MTLKEKFREHRLKGRGRRAFWIALAIGLALVVVSAGSRSHRNDRDRTHRAAERGSFAAAEIDTFLAENGRWLERAGISTEQADEIAAVLRRAAPEIDALRAEREQVTRELTLAFEDPGDLDRIDELLQQIKELSGRAIDQGFFVAVDIADVLTPEQRRELLEHWSERS